MEATTNTRTTKHRRLGRLIATLYIAPCFGRSSLDDEDVSGYVSCAVFSMHDRIFTKCFVFVIGSGCSGGRRAASDCRGWQPMRSCKGHGRPDD